LTSDNPPAERHNPAGITPEIPLSKSPDAAQSGGRLLYKLSVYFPENIRLDSKFNLEVRRKNILTFGYSMDDEKKSAYQPKISRIFATIS